MATSKPLAPESDRALVSTGIAGLDQVLGGGLTPHRLYLLEGVPGSGKTTLGLQFLLAGVRAGESVLYVTLSETKEELLAVAESHDWSLDGVHIHELMPTEASLDPEQQYTMFHPSEVELSQTTHAILGRFEEVKPARIVFDSLSELRLLAGNPLRYRRQILALKQFFAGRNCTVVLLDDRTAREYDLQVQSIAHGVIELDQLEPEYGADRRRLRVVKYRGRKFSGGYHDFLIRRGGIEVFERLVAAAERRSSSRAQIQSGVPELDMLLGGGVERGTSTLLTGASGTGKSSLAGRFVFQAAERGQRGALFLFDESIQTFLARMAGLGMDLRPHLASERVAIEQVDPAELSPGEFVHRVASAARRDGATVIVIDSLNGYLQAMPGDGHLILQLHELLTYLGQLGIATFLVAVQQGLIGSHMVTPIDATYLADSVVLLRYFEARGQVRQAISVLKKRGSAHERTIRELQLSESGIQIGEPLSEFRGVLTGVPTYEGSGEPLLQRPPS